MPAQQQATTVASPPQTRPSAETSLRRPNQQVRMAVSTPHQLSGAVVDCYVVPNGVESIDRIESINRPGYEHTASNKNSKPLNVPPSS
jgi:hypothetical protein